MFGFFWFKDHEVYFFSNDPIGKTNVNSNLEQEKHMSCNDCFICTNGSDFTNEWYDIIFKPFKLLHDQNKEFDRGKK